MNPKTIAEEIRETIDEDSFDDLEEKLEALQLLADFESARSAMECPMCHNPGESGRMLDDCDGSDLGRCEYCKGIGYVPKA